MLLLMLLSLLVLLAVLAVFLLFYNLLVRLRNRATAAWHGVEVELKRRYDLIPVMVNTVKGYAAHESAAFQQAAEARGQGMRAASVGEHAGATDSSSASFTTLFAIAEAYPDLKASQEFRELQQELSHTETVIANARKYYNACVMHYDNARQRFPGNLVAGLFPHTFPEMEYLELGTDLG
jgi:LemA protein